MDRYTVFKQTGTHADVLAAIGAADVLRHLEPRLVEFADRFQIQLRRHLLPSDLDAIDPGFSYLLRPQKTSPSLPPERILQTTAARAEHGAQCATVSENRMYSILGRMKAYSGPNQIVSRFAKMKREEWAAKVWEGFSGNPAFVASSPLVQLFNPQAAKGYALLKPNGTSRRDKTKDRWAEPFLEWLRFRGYFEGSTGWFASGDIRLLSPIPADVPFSELAGAVAAFRQLRLGGTAAKMDCRAMLGLTRLVIQGSEVNRPPNRSVRGVWVTQHKDMGQAHTVMTMEQLAIPDWFELRTVEDAQLWLQTLEEHDVALRRLTDSHSDEFALLKQYRRTFQTRWQESLPEFVEFLAGYGLLLFKRRSRDHWALPQFTMGGVISILTRDPGLSAIIRNPGFLAAAAAVRSATFGAQAARHSGKLNHREIRYGLLADIRRAGLSGKRELLTLITSFICGFNREATKRQATGLPASHIRNHEMDVFAGLVERLPYAMNVGSLLCGFASCVRSESAAAADESEMAQAIPA